jgi:hypothetical protein
MTTLIVAAVLLGLTGIALLVVLRRLKKDRDRQQANILALESMTASIKAADRRRFEDAMLEDRALVRKLRSAMNETAGAPGPR